MKTRDAAAGHDTHENEWMARLSAYLDGDLSPEERALVEQHIVDCQPCAQLLEEYRRVASWLRSDPPSVPGPHVLGGVLAGIDARVETPIERRRQLLRRWGLAAAAAITALVIYRSVPVGSDLTTGADRPERVVTSRPPLRAAPGVASSPRAAPPHDQAIGPESYAAAVVQLQRDINGARDMLGSRAFAELQQSLAAIDRALEDAEKAQRADPGNATLGEYVRGIREHRLATMRAVTSNIEGRREALRG
jgi:hypothetical protein